MIGPVAETSKYPPSGYVLAARALDLTGDPVDREGGGQGAGDPLVGAGALDDRDRTGRGTAHRTGIRVDVESWVGVPRVHGDRPLRKDHDGLVVDTGLVPASLMAPVIMNGPLFHQGHDPVDGDGAVGGWRRRHSGRPEEPGAERGNESGAQGNPCPGARQATSLTLHEQLRSLAIESRAQGHPDLGLGIAIRTSQ